MLNFRLQSNSKSGVGLITANRRPAGTFAFRQTHPNYAPTDLVTSRSDLFAVYGYSVLVRQFDISMIAAGNYEPWQGRTVSLSGAAYNYVKTSENTATLTIHGQVFKLIFTGRNTGFVLTPEGPAGYFELNKN